jgi:hypothetical protein
MSPTDELVERLRYGTPMAGIGSFPPCVAEPTAKELEAADTIERLMHERDEAQRENMNMVWQRRSAEFRADSAEARIAELITLIADVRALALEDAAKVADDYMSYEGVGIAYAIRALKESRP